MGVKVQFRVFKGSDGTPLTGLSLTFAEYVRRTGSVDTDLLSSAPAITELISPTAEGAYEFETLDGQALLGSTIRWLVDLGPDSAARYEYGVIDGIEVVSSTSPLGLNANALTTLEALKIELGISGTDLDQVLIRLINGATDTIEQYCDRKFAYDSAWVEKVAGYGTELIHLEHTPVWEISAITVDGELVSADDYAIKDGEVGSVFSGLPWPDTAPFETTTSPHRRAGFEERAIEVTYSGGFALVGSDRVASDCPAWQGSHSYTTVGAKVTNGGRIYKLITAGVSASSGGPTGMGTSILDGSAIWDFLSPAYPEPSDLEEACLQLAVFRFRRRGRDVSLQSEQIGRTSRMWDRGNTGPSGIPQAIKDILDGYARVR